MIHQEQDSKSRDSELAYSNGIRPKRVVWYEDKETGATLRRPAFEKLQRDISTAKVATVASSEVVHN